MIDIAALLLATSRLVGSAVDALVGLVEGSATRRADPVAVPVRRDDPRGPRLGARQR